MKMIRGLFILTACFTWTMMWGQADTSKAVNLSNLFAAIKTIYLPYNPYNLKLDCFKVKIDSSLSKAICKANFVSLDKYVNADCEQQEVFSDLQDFKYDFTEFSKSQDFYIAKINTLKALIIKSKNTRNTYIATYKVDTENGKNEISFIDVIEVGTAKGGNSHWGYGRMATLFSKENIIVELKCYPPHTSVTIKISVDSKGKIAVFMQ